MRSTLITLLGGLGANTLVILGFWLSGRGVLVPSLLAGALLPILMSASLIYVASRYRGRTPMFFQQLNIIGFGLKIILIGAWAAIMITGPDIDKVTFIVTLLINFLAMHMTEAYHWPLFMGGGESKNGDET